MSEVFFTPWVGDDYASGKRFGKRVMILGEAHYQWDHDIEPYPELTRTAIRNQITGAHSYAFWTRIVSAFFGHKPNLAEKQDFWRSVAFYNYVQKNVGHGPRVAPTDEMWTRSEAPFKGVLHELAPQVLIVLGYRLWNRIPDLDGAEDQPIDGANQTRTWRYPLPQGGSCLAYGIRHPSSGFTGSKWQPHILEVIKRAGDSPANHPRSRALN